MYAGITAAATLAIVAILTVAYRVLKTAHSRPRTAPAGSAGPSHTPLERAVLTTIGTIIKTLLRRGIPLGPMRLLTVNGRTTGLPRTNPVDLFEHDGRFFLVATHTAQAAWVHNLRAAGTGELVSGRRTRRTFTATELTGDQAAEILKTVVGGRMARPVAGFVLRQTIDIAPNASAAEYARITADHPVFELTLTQAPESDRVRRIRRPAVPALLIGAGAFLVFIHLTLGLTGVMTTAQWTSGMVVGLLAAGLGNHLRIFGRR